MKDVTSIAATLHALADSVSSRLAQTSIACARIRGVRDLLDANEYGVAFEVFCENVHEYSVPLQRDEILLFRELGAILPDMDRYTKLLDDVDAI